MEDEMRERQSFKKRPPPSLKILLLKSTHLFQILKTKLRTFRGSPEFPNQNLREISLNYDRRKEKQTISCNAINNFGPIPAFRKKVIHSEFVDWFPFSSTRFPIFLVRFRFSEKVNKNQFVCRLPQFISIRFRKFLVSVRGFQKKLIIRFPYFVSAYFWSVSGCKFSVSAYFLFSQFEIKSKISG